MKVNIEVDIPDGDGCGITDTGFCEFFEYGYNHCFLFKKELHTNKKCSECLARIERQKREDRMSGKTMPNPLQTPNINMDIFTPLEGAFGPSLLESGEFNNELRGEK